MRPVEFTPETIIEAGLALQAAGRNITGFALRQKVGGGDPSRLKQVWAEHVAGQTVQATEPVADLPLEVAEEVKAVSAALTDRLASMAVELNDKAVKAAERRVHEVVRSAGEQREQAERELGDAAQTVEDLEGKLDEAVARAVALEERLHAAGEANQALAVELAQMKERQALSERANKDARTQDRNDLTAQKEATAAALAEVDRARTELANLRAAADAAGQVHEANRKAADVDARRAADRVAKAEAGQEMARLDAAAAREDAAKMRGQLEATQAQAAELLRVVGQAGGAAGVKTATKRAKLPAVKRAAAAKKV